MNAAKRQNRLEPVPDEFAPLSQNGDAAGQHAVREWLALLPERQRVAVFLRYFADLDYRSIALALDVEVGTVSATLSAAHRRLRQMIEEVPQ